MNRSKNLVLLGVGALIAFSVVFSCGCEESVKKSGADEADKPIFYPPAPDMPRIQFLASFSGSDDVIGERQVGAFESFIVGDADMSAVTDIKKPYGVAIHNNKLYVCDIDRKTVQMLDLEDGSFEPMATDRRMMLPGSIWIHNGIKYVGDPSAGTLFVFDQTNKLAAIWGKEWGIKPIDVVVRGPYVYILDGENSQVIVADRKTGELIKRIGTFGDGPGQLKYVTGLAVDYEGNIYVSDQIKSIVTKLDSEGVYLDTIGFQSANIHGFQRPKGMDIDKEGRLWILDSGTAVGKAYDDEGRLLLYFGLAGTAPGQMYLPVRIRVDYEHVDLFQKYAYPESELELLIIVTNQFGPNKVAVYGLGKFPKREKEIQAQIERQMNQTIDFGEDEEVKSESTEAAQPDAPADAAVELAE